MRRIAAFALLLALAGAALADGDGLALAATNAVTTNLVSNVQTAKGWRRYHVIGVEGGTLRDASGTIADYASGAAVEASAALLPEIAAAANEGLTNALARLYAVTNNIGNFTDRVYVAGDLSADDVERENFYAYVAGEAWDGVNDVLYVWFPAELPSAPRIKWRYTTSVGEYWVAGDFETPWDTKTYTVNGFEGCHKCVVARPREVCNITMRVNAYPQFGSEADGFDFARRRFALVDGVATNLPWTGSWTNRAGVVHRWNNGVYLGVLDE